MAAKGVQSASSSSVATTPYQHQPLSPLSLVLYSQRTQAPEFCDVVLKCGPETSHVHGCVLAARSEVLEKVIRQLSGAAAAGAGGGGGGNGRPAKVQLDVDGLFSGIEPLFQDIVTYLYLGQRPANIGEEEMKIAHRRLGLKFDIVKSSAATADASVAVAVKSLVAGSSQGSGVVTASKDEIPMDFSICSKCDLLFISKEEYLAHAEHNCARKFSCKACGAMFTRVQSLLEHLVEVRHGETVCSVCDHVTHSSQEMEQHVREHLRTPGKPYLCLQCDSRFGTRNGLLMHIPKHSAETPFVCQICSKGFKWKHALTAHMVIHSASKKYLCQECGFSTSHTSVLKRHRRIHSGQTLKCALPDCTFETVRKQNLVQHQLTHSKEKPHQCEVCGKSFSLVKNMRRHALQHDYNALKYQCKVKNCQFGTIRSDKFAEHMRRHHPEEQEIQRMSVAAAAKRSTTAAVAAVAADRKAAIAVAPTATVTSSEVTVASKAEEVAKAAEVAQQNPGVGGEKPKLLKNPFDTINPPNRTITNYDTSTFTGVGTSTQQNFVLSDVTLGQVPEDPGHLDSRGGNRAAAEAAAHAAVVESTLNSIDVDLV